ncbi:hypothetical protein ACHAXN_008434 [Cyclotella atomus]
MAYTSLSTSKHRAKLGATLNESAASHSPFLLSSSFAKRHLQKMGWTEGTGLGRKRDGMVEHVKIKQREEEAGLGKEKELLKAAADVWWKDSVGGTLARLQKKKKSSKEKMNIVKTFTDEELFQATGGARFGMRAQRRAEGKWKRTEGGHQLEQLEKKAVEGMEWNGRGDAYINAKVVIDVVSRENSISTSISKQKKRKREGEHEEEDEVKRNSNHQEISREDNVGSESEKRRLKKLRKEAKKSKSKVILPRAEEEEEEEKEDADAAVNDTTAASVHDVVADGDTVALARKDKKKKKKKKSKKESCK